MSDARVLLVAMPFVHATSTSLALALLGEILGRAGIAVDCLHGSLLYPRTPLWDSENGLRFLINYGGLLFGAWLADDPSAYQAPFLEFMCRDYLNELSLQGLNPEVPAPTPDGERTTRAGDGPAPFSREWAAPRIAREIENAGRCLDRCFARARNGRYDVVGFSVTFFTQLPASIALARRLKAADPHVRIVFGGAGCVAEQAEGILRSFPVVDAVCFTEADDLIADLVRALRGEHDLARVPGIVYRDAQGALRRTSEPPLRRDLDALPLPDHRPYFAQHAASEWADTRPIVFFETSRGCWWGQKHLCTFCGLSERELAFRSKSPDRLYDEIEHLYRAFPNAAYLHPTDDILDTRYFRTLLPRLARMPRDSDRPLRLFFEVKSNMRAPHLLLLRRAGVEGVQPGIESFSDEILRLMDKGATGLQQVQFIKWATQAGVRLVYNLLIRNPGESVAAYREMIALVPHLVHLPPPSNVVITELERFSPYFLRPEAFGITNVRPKAYHRLVFPTEGVDLDGIAYRFDYDHPIKHDSALIEAQRELVRLVRRWGRAYEPSQRYWVDRGDHVLVADRRAGVVAPPRFTLLAGLAADLFRYLDRTRRFDAIARRFAQIDPAFLRARLAAWHAEGIIYSAAHGDEHLALLPRVWDRAPALDEILAELDEPPAAAPPTRQSLVTLPARPRSPENELMKEHVTSC